MGQILYVTGTDTGVGKTVFCGLLFSALRATGRNVRVVKPFSSGLREDGELLRALQDGKLTIEELNPRHFAEPIAPALAAKSEGHTVTLSEAMSFLREHQRHCDYLLVEGAGGLLSPLGEAFDFGDMIRELPGKVAIVAPNKLGVINHTRLTIEALKSRSAERCVLILMPYREADTSSSSNAQALRNLTHLPLYEIPALSISTHALTAIRDTARSHHELLMELWHELTARAETIVQPP